MNPYELSLASCPMLALAAGSKGHLADLSKPFPATIGYLVRRSEDPEEVVFPDLPAFRFGVSQTLVLEHRSSWFSNFRLPGSVSQHSATCRYRGLDGYFRHTVVLRFNVEKDDVELYGICSLHVP